MLAVACIVGGGLVAGGVTLALASGPALPSYECATTVGPDADVVVSLGGEGLVVVTPDTRVREVKECMARGGIAKARLEAELASAANQGARDEVERARREVERARREADRVRQEVDRVRLHVRRAQAGEVDRAELERRVRVQAQREAAGVARQAARAAREAARAERDAVRGQREAVRGQREAVRSQREAVRSQREAVRSEREGALGEREAALAEVDVTGSLSEGLRVALPGRTFQVRFEGIDDLRLDGAAVEDALRLQLQVLEGLELDFEGIDEDLAREIEIRLEEEMDKLQERLERLENGGL
jgi:hypothetical protein